MSDLINKEDALYAIEVGRDNWASPNNFEAWWVCGEMRDAIRKAIESLPTVDAEPIRHGRWIYHSDWADDGECPYECPYCGRTYDYNMNFCGFCGAKMDEVTK